MAENAPPADAQANASSEATRGMPYYEKLRRDLREALAKKRVLDAALNTIEENIFRAESSYLEETSAGNIVKGFDNYIKGSTTSTSGGAAASNAARRKAAINDQDRIFSRSSQSFILNDSPGPTSAQTTPSHAPTPTSSFPGASNHPTPGSTASKAPNKKRPSAKDDEDTDGKPSKRGKITYGRD
ncbi:histone acetyltransferase subunit NuA4-domain-containing protein [Macrophomina phaseolina]|uniref:Chromatin modification-related protein EAF6 n=1 Tax=Macrophomina phaseolina TaxID=35725 RepID=A0ABQ8GLR7_9PEZI|nr:histone acetyltransferase subunit NuA4-domain-containing protein [Macrophomina phaseolina]